MIVEISHLPEFLTVFWFFRAFRELSWGADKPTDSQSENVLETRIKNPRNDAKFSSSDSKRFSKKLYKESDDAYLYVSRE